MKVFNLLYIERPTMSDCMSTLSSTIHSSYEDALQKVWDYVAGNADSSGMIEEKCLDEFIEAIGDNQFEIPLFDFTGDDDEPITSDELKKLFASVSNDTKEEIVDWYFNLMDDDTCEAVYKINEHEL